MITHQVIQESDVNRSVEFLMLSNWKFKKITINRYRPIVVINNSLYRFDALIITDLKQSYVDLLKIIIQQINQSHSNTKLKTVYLVES